MNTRYEFSLVGDVCKRRLIFASDIQEAIERMEMIASNRKLSCEGILPRLVLEKKTIGELE